MELGEVVWVDDLGVTCRRWNWRQGVRTRVHEDTERVFFLFERLSPFPVEKLYAAGDEVVARVTSARLTGGKSAGEQGLKKYFRDRPELGEGNFPDSSCRLVDCGRPVIPRRRITLLMPVNQRPTRPRP